MKGILIAIEGIDGAGKTTQAHDLAKALRAAGENVLLSKEPTDGQWGRRIRESAANGRLPADEELHCLVQDRREHLDTLIRPALAKGWTVVLDRYFYSSVAYQGSRMNDPAGVEAQMRGFCEPADAVFLLDIEPTLSIDRIRRRDFQPNVFENTDNLTRSRAVFNSFVGRDPVVHQVDGSQSEAAVYAAIIHRLVEGALKAKRCAKQYGCDDPVTCGFRMTESCPWVQLRRALLPRSAAVAAGALLASGLPAG